MITCFFRGTVNTPIKYHPLKKVLFVSASAFMTCLKHLDFEHSSMFAPNEFKATVSKAFKDLRQVFWEDTAFISGAVT